MSQAPLRGARDRREYFALDIDRMRAHEEPMSARQECAMTAGIRTSIALATAFAGANVLGCATTHVKTDQDPRVNLENYRSFDVKTGQVFVNGVPDRRDTLVRDRVEAALTRELTQKGLAENPQSPDLIATYTAGARDIVELDDWYGVGYGGPWAEEYTESTLLIDLIDPKTNKLVWRSIVKMDDEDDLRNSKKVASAVDKALKKFPPET